MSENTALQQFVPATLAELYTFATRLAKSRLIPKALQDKPDDVAVVLLAGHELGLPPMLSLRTISVVEGKLTLAAELMLALCLRSSACRYFRLVASTDEVCTYETQRSGDREPVQLSFTIEQAQCAGLTGKDNWRKYPAAMLRARCAAALARSSYPDVVAGVYDPDELQHDRADATATDVSTPATDQSLTDRVFGEMPQELVEELSRNIREAKTQESLDSLVPTIRMMSAEHQKVLRQLWGKQRALIRDNALPDPPPVPDQNGPRVWAMRQRCLDDDGSRWVGLISAQSRQQALESADACFPAFTSTHWAWEAHAYFDLTLDARTEVGKQHALREQEQKAPQDNAGDK